MTCSLRDNFTHGYIRDIPLINFKLKSTLRMTTRSRNQKSQGVRDTPLTPRMGEEEKALLETIRKIVKDELASHQLAIKEMINDNVKVTNDHLDRISQDVTELKQSLEFMQEQMKEEINKIKILKT